MASGIPCVPCNVTTQTTNVPGPAGANALTTTSASFVIPAVGNAVTVSVGDTSIFTQNENIFVGGANFRIATILSSTSLSLVTVGLPDDTAVGQTVASGSLVSPGLGQYRVPATLVAVNDLTDNTTGAASDTLAAGVGAYNVSFPITIVAGTGAADYVTSFTVGHAFKLLSWAWVTAVAVAGAGGSRTFNLAIGGVAVGGTINVTTTNDATIGHVNSSAASGGVTGSASAVISIQVAGGGTSITGGSGCFVVRIQNMDTANAAASIASKLNSVLDALR